MGRNRLLPFRSVSLRASIVSFYWSLLPVLILPQFPPTCRPPVQTIVTQSVRGRGDPPSDAVFKVASIAQGLQASDSSMKIPKALCGRVANVVIWEDQQWALVREHAPVGTFLRLRNVDVRRWQKNTFRCKFVISSTPTNPVVGLSCT